MARRSIPMAQTLLVLVAAGLPLAGCASGGVSEASGGAAGTAAEPVEAPGGAAETTEPAGPGAAVADDAATTAAAEPEAETDAAPKAAPGGIFTEVQARRGRTAFDETCSECHTTSEFRGRTFQRTWGRRTVYSFFRTIRSTMPDDNPGGLEEQVYLDVVSYILSMNGHDGGAAELGADSPMREVRIAPPEPPR